MPYDSVETPSHYVQQSAVVQPIELLRDAPFDIGNALKYWIRAGHKGDKLEDLRKSLKYAKWAEETSNSDSEQYLLWFKRKALLLPHFDCGFMSHRIGFFTWLDSMIEALQREIKLLQNQQKESTE